MSQNPLFPTPDEPDDDASSKGSGYLLPDKRHKVVQPGNGVNQAANVIRDKLARLYAEEPDARAEEQEAETVTRRSPHQEFMYQLSTSGKSLAEIQTEWHNYYINLPDEQKHQVWQEFYEANDTAKHQAATTKPKPAEPAKPSRHRTAKHQSARHEATSEQANVVVSADHAPEQTSADERTRPDIQNAIRRRVSNRASKLSKRHRQNLHSLLFGLTTGFVVLVIFMFSFFNQVIIAPFIQPGRAGATPIIIDSDSVAASGSPKVIIPKINVEIPVVYNLSSNDETVIENNLENGVVHYPTTVRPGQTGNAAFFGHSSNNIFNPGHYKFAFVLLHELQPGDIFYLTYNKTVYAYKVFDRKIVDPSEVGVLNDVPGHKATATLITCDPPGTSLHRLVVVGDQISPNPAGNSTGHNTTGTGGSSSTAQLAGNGPSLWSRIWHWLF